MPERFHDDHRRGLARFLSTGQGNVIGKTVELVGRRNDGSEFPMDLSLAAWQTGEPSQVGGGRQPGGEVPQRWLDHHRVAQVARRGHQVVRGREHGTGGHGHAGPGGLLDELGLVDQAAQRRVQ